MELSGVLVKNIIQDFHRRLDGIFPDREVSQFIYMLFEEYLGWEKTRVHLAPEVEISGPVIKSFYSALDELSSGKPIQYVLGKSWFNGTLLKVDENVLIPRPETEELCSIIKADHPENQNLQISILDVGTGSGCIAIDLKKHFPLAQVTAVDISSGALEIAGMNAISNHCEISFIHADILNETNWITLGNFNVIVSNPPYVIENEKTLMHRNVTEFEPDEALFVKNNDPLRFYSAITRFAISHLNSSGSLYFEINERYGKEVRELVLSFGFNEAAILKDFHGKERFVAATLKSPLAPPL